MFLVLKYPVILGASVATLEGAPQWFQDVLEIEQDQACEALLRNPVLLVCSKGTNLGPTVAFFMAECGASVERTWAAVKPCEISSTRPRQRVRARSSSLKAGLERATGGSRAV